MTYSNFHNIKVTWDWVILGLTFYTVIMVPFNLAVYRTGYTSTGDITFLGKLNLPKISYRNGWNTEALIFEILEPVEIKSKFYKKRGATFFYDVTHKLGPLDFTQYRSKSSSF